jgi:hypothetical protein
MQSTSVTVKTRVPEVVLSLTTRMALVVTGAKCEVHVVHLPSLLKPLGMLYHASAACVMVEESTSQLMPSQPALQVYWQPALARSGTVACVQSTAGCVSLHVGSSKLPLKASQCQSARLWLTFWPRWWSVHEPIATVDGNQTVMSVLALTWSAPPHVVAPLWSAGAQPLVRRCQWR